MTSPALAAARFAIALGVGAALGLFYGFLRPLRPRLTHLADGIFIVATFLAWVWLSFGACGGDLRFGYWAGMLLGAILWEATAGRLLRPLFFGFWRLIGKILVIFFLPLGKFLIFFKKICKKVLAFPKKVFIMGRSICRGRRHRNGGAAHGKAKKKKSQGGAAQEQSPAALDDSGGHRIVYGGAGGPPRQY